MQNDRVQFLIDNLQESLEVEVKNWLGGLSDNTQKAKLAKELIALANNGGGLLFIGFDEETDGHPEIEPNEVEAEAFSQDNIASIVQKYVEPPCQCKVNYFSRTGSTIKHPVIEVPGEHRTPVWARSGSPDAEPQSLKSATVYVRRPGGYSEPARTQDDWEKLIDRLVKARQTDMLEAIRQIINPASVDTTVSQPKLEDWDNESYNAWLKLLEKLPASSPNRHLSGHWTFSFSVHPFKTPTLAELNQALDREMPKYSGWPPFTYLHGEPKRPHALGNIVQAWLADIPESDSSDSSHSDFWRVSRNGFGFLLRPMQEDRLGFARNRSPAPVKPLFDWSVNIYRAIELIKYVEAIALRFSDENAAFQVLMKYRGMENRRLFNHDWNYNLDEDLRCIQPAVDSQLSARVHSIRTNIEELVYSLLAPIFEQFEFAELPKWLVDTIVKETLGNRGA
jgi:Putative DNA-binding domain